MPHVSFATALLDVLFPPACAACGELLPAAGRASTSLELCAACEVTLTPIDRACRRCGLPGEALVDSCPGCLADVPAFDGATSAYLYGEAIAKVLHRFKYENRPLLAGPLGERLAALDLPEADLVSWVPLHPARRRARRYDQALYLAQSLAKRRGLPCEETLRRVRRTERQVGRSRDERSVNVEGAFSLVTSVRDRRIWLVDDVVTTGATAGACAQVLVDAGAADVHVVSVARAVA